MGPHLRSLYPNFQQNQHQPNNQMSVHLDVGGYRPSEFPPGISQSALLHFHGIVSDHSQTVLLDVQHMRYLAGWIFQGNLVYLQCYDDANPPVEVSHERLYEVLLWILLVLILPLY